MKRSKLALAVVTFGLLTAGVSGSAFGQAQPAQPGQPGQPGAGGNRGRGNFDPAQFRTQMLTRLKEKLGASDDEWKVLQPRVEKVYDASRAARVDRGGFGRTRPGGDNATPSTTPQTDLAKATSELRAAADNKASTPEECAQKLVVFRAARDKAKAEFASAQKELKELLTPKQEAILVAEGTLE